LARPYADGTRIFMPSQNEWIDREIEALLVAAGYNVCHRILWENGMKPGVGDHSPERLAPHEL